VHQIAGPGNHWLVVVEQRQVTHTIRRQALATAAKALQRGIIFKAVARAVVHYLRHFPITNDWIHFSLIGPGRGSRFTTHD
jgi:hypothetical protein